jgi:hypothetical protein
MMLQVLITTTNFKAVLLLITTHNKKEGMIAQILPGRY